MADSRFVNKQAKLILNYSVTDFIANRKNRELFSAVDQLLGLPVTWDECTDEQVIALFTTIKKFKESDG